MGAIYSGAKSCLIWLGEESEKPVPVRTEEEKESLDELLQESDDRLKEIFSALPHLGLPDGLHSILQAGGQPPTSSSDDNFSIAKTRIQHWNQHLNPLKADFAGDSERVEFENDSLYQAYCLLRLLEDDFHLGEIPHLKVEPEGLHTYITNSRRALHWLASRPWWTRIWTVQESILPRECVLLYGPVQIPWDTLLNGIENFQKHRTSCCADVPGVGDMLNLVVDSVLHLRRLRQNWHSPPASVSTAAKSNSLGAALDRLKRPETLLWNFRHRQAKDPRDKIYGILSLITDQSAQDAIPVDYDPKTTSEKVFTRAVSRIIKITGRLDILCQPGYATRNPMSMLPTWVPNFAESLAIAGTLEHFTEQLPLYDASGGRGASARTIEDNIMVLEGCLVDRVESTASAMMYVFEKPQKETIKQWYDHAQGFYSSISHDQWKPAFVRTVSGDTIQHGVPVGGSPGTQNTMRRLSSTGNSHATDEAILSAWLTAQGLDGAGPVPEADTSPQATQPESSLEIGHLSHAIKISTISRKFFISGNGAMGLASHFSGLIYPKKDEIFVFPGGKTPFVLRPVGMRHVPGLGMKPCHELIGDCYLHGMMDGEGMRNFDREKETVYLV